MAGLNERRCHLAFLDSRGNGLQGKVVKINRGEYLEIREYKGATLHQLAKIASKHLNSYPFDVVYIAGGACDITTKNSNTKVISFEWSPQKDLAAHLAGTLSWEDEYFTKKHPAARVVFCPLVGVELKRVIVSQKITEEDQNLVDRAVFNFNENVFAVNKRRNTYSPSLHRTIHRSTGNKLKSHYHHLEDGIHLTEDQKSKWADMFVKATTHN